MPHWSFSEVTTGTGAMAASATISVTTCACHLKGVPFAQQTYLGDPSAPLYLGEMGAPWLRRC
eukprot:scaffold83223_cov24-Phaeocystis_antarctica.AAC.1